MPSSTERLNQESQESINDYAVVRKLSPLAHLIFAEKLDGNKILDCISQHTNSTLGLRGQLAILKPESGSIVDKDVIEAIFKLGETFIITHPRDNDDDVDINLQTAVEGFCQAGRALAKIYHYQGELTSSFMALSTVIAWSRMYNITAEQAKAKTEASYVFHVSALFSNDKLESLAGTDVLILELEEQIKTDTVAYELLPIDETPVRKELRKSLAIRNNNLAHLYYTKAVISETTALPSEFIDEQIRLVSRSIGLLTTAINFFNQDIQNSVGDLRLHKALVDSNITMALAQLMHLELKNYQKDRILHKDFFEYMKSWTDRYRAASEVFNRTETSKQAFYKPDHHRKGLEGLIVLIEGLDGIIPVDIDKNKQIIRDMLQVIMTEFPDLQMNASRENYIAIGKRIRQTIIDETVDSEDKGMLQLRDSYYQKVLGIN